jgi:hypothetical protein
MDRDTLIREFETVRSIFAEELAETVEESTYIINVLSTLLPASEVELRRSQEEKVDFIGSQALFA